MLAIQPTKLLQCFCFKQLKSNIRVRAVKFVLLSSMAYQLDVFLEYSAF